MTSRLHAKRFRFEKANEIYLLAHACFLSLFCVFPNRFRPMKRYRDAMDNQFTACEKKTETPNPIVESGHSMPQDQRMQSSAAIPS